ncbi:MAG: B12-binding domain-containing radical SAM protein [Lachnospiraceae bacterium]|nr:B12-binding domain-containing radical SAM protein [Lachnospiraceae bacterium]
MDIVLINPLYPRYESNMFASALAASLDMPPLGLLYIAANLEKYGYTVKVYDFNLSTEQEIERISDEIFQSNPKIIGLSVSTPNYNYAVTYSKKIREKLGQRCKIVFGGYHVSFLPDECLAESAADIVVLGEGEHIFVELADKIIRKKGSALEEKQGIAFINENGEIYNRNAHLLRIDDLNSLPFPDRSLLPMERYKTPATVMGSRGCVARCDFCASGAWGGIKLRSPENIVAELWELKREFDFEHICFIDNTFTANRERTYQVADAIAASGLDFTYSLETRVSNVDDSLVEKLKQMNTIAVQFGVETGNDQVMKDIQKDITLDRVYKAVETCLKHGLRVMCTFIIGHPTDTSETIQDTVNAIRKIKRMGGQAKIEMLTPYPGTPVFLNRDKKGLVIKDWNYDHWGATTSPVFETKNFTQRQLQKRFIEAVMEVNTI